MTEKRYESDLTGKEKRQLEWEKIKKMSWKERIGYIWAYYKPHMVIALAIILVLYIIGQMIYRSQFETVFYAALLNSGNGDAEAMEMDFKEYIGDEDKYHEICMDSSMFFTGDEGADYTSIMKLTTLIAAREIEVLLAPEEKFQEYAVQGAFLPMNEVLTDEQIQAYGENVEEYSLKIQDSKKMQQFGMEPMEPLHLGVMVTAKHMDNVKSFITYIYEGGTS